MRPLQLLASLAAVIAILAGCSPPAGPGREAPAAAAATSQAAPCPGRPGSAAKILCSAQGPIHLGDEDFPGWSHLYGNSFEMELHLDGPISDLSLMVQTYGLEINAPVYLNYRKVAVLPRQIITPGTLEKPDAWSPDRTISLPAANLCPGLNVITITTDLVPGPRLSGDLDDFQIKNLRVIAR